MLQSFIIYLEEQITLYSLFWIFFLSLGLYVFTKLNRYWKQYSYLRWKLPGPKLDNPILGMNVIQYNRQDIEMLENKLKDYPMFARMIFGPMFSIWVTGPEVMQEIINKADVKNRNFLYMVIPLLGNGLITSEGSIWKRNRKLLTPTFRFESLQNFVKIMNKSADRMIQVINRESNGKDPIEFVPLINNMTLEVILGCICSKDMDLQLDIDRNSREMEYVHGLENIKYGFSKRFTLINLFDIIYYNREAGKKFMKGTKMTKQYIISLIQEREAMTREEPHTEEGKTNYDMLDLLMKSRDEEGKGLSHKEIIDELNTFVFAGHDTTGSASSFVFYLLAKYQDLQEKCREEVIRVMGDKSEIEWKDLAQLSYLTCFIKESLRLYPPGLVSSKVIDEPITLDGYTIPANTSLDIFILLIHRNAKHWPEPNKFDPTRFNDENILNHHPFAFVPFSAGSRNCIGQNFAMSELKIITSKLIRNFQVSLQNGYEMDTDVKVVLSPSDNLPLIFKSL